MKSLHLVFSLSLGLSFVVGQAQTSEVVTVKADSVDFGWTIPVQIDGGKLGNFLITSSGGKSSVSRKFLGSDLVGPARTSKHRLKFGTIEVNDVEMIDGEFKYGDERIVGILGLDVFQKMALGFDFVKGEWTFWLKGGLDSAAAKSWIREVEAWPGVSTPPDCSTVPFKLGDHGVMLEGQFGSDKQLVNLNIAAGWSQIMTSLSKKLKSGVLQPRTTRGMEGERNLIMGYGFALGGEDPTWLAHFLENTESSSKATPMIGMYDLKARRFILDLPGKKLYKERSSEEVQLSFVATQMLGMPVRVKDDRLFIGPSYLRPLGDGIAPLLDKGVITYAGLSPKDLIAWLKQPSSTSFDGFVKLGEGIKKSFVVEIDLDPGTYTLTVTVGSR